MKLAPFFTLLVLASCCSAVVEARGAGPQRNVRVVADVAHAGKPSERTVLDQGPTGFSRLWRAFTKSSHVTRINREPFSAESLANVDLLLITAIAPGKVLVPAEAKALRAYIERGGMLLLTNNDLTPAGVGVWADLAESLGIQSPGSAPRITGEAKDGRWHVSRYSGGALTRWLGKVEDGPLYSHGVIASPVDGAVLVSYDGTSLAAKKQIGRGSVYAFGGGDMIGNRFAAPDPPETYDTAKQSPLNRLLIDALVEEMLADAPRH